MRNRLAVYIRVSTDNEEQKSSIINQKEMFIQYAKEHNYTIIDFYTDIQSGTSEKRPDFERLLVDAQNDVFDIIVSKELSRLSRNVELAYKLKRVITDYNIDLITTEGAVNTLDECTEFFGLHAWIAEYGARQASHRIKKSLNARAHSGLFNGSIPPYGYYCADSKLYLRDDNTPDVVRRIFSEYISGKGIDTIARGLFKDNIPTNSQINCKKNASNVWHGKSVKKILTNLAYIGSLEQLRERTVDAIIKKRAENNVSSRAIVEDTHDAIISKETFLIVQDLIKSRYKERGHQATHLFTNILKCPDCGKGFHFKKNRQGYVCGTSVKLGTEVCSSHLVKEEYLKESILNYINSLMTSIPTQSYYNEINVVYSKKLAKFENALKHAENKVKKLEERKISALESFLDRDISKNEYEAIKVKYNPELDKLSIDIESLKSSLSILKSPSTLEKVSTFKPQVAKVNTLTPEILNKFIEKIEISEDGSATIYHRCK